VDRFERRVRRIQRPRWRTWVWRIVVGALVALLTIGACLYAYWHHQVATQLQESLAELDLMDPGWRLHDIEAARAEIPDAENSARCAMRVSRLLPKGWPAQDVVKAFENLEPPERLSQDQSALLNKELNALQPALAEALELARMPNGRHRITYLRNVLNTLLEDQQKVRAVTALLRYEALRSSEGGDMKGAMRACHATLNAARSLGDEPMPISQLVRIACVVVACQAVERTLAQGQPGSKDLTDLQQILEEEDAHPTALIAMRGERAQWHEMFDALESGDVLLSQMGDRPDTPPDWRDTYLGWVHRDRIRNEHPLSLSLMTRWVEEARLPVHEQGRVEQGFTDELRNLPSHAVITRLMFPALNKFSEACRRKHAHVRCLAVALAAERYRRKHGDWPETLDRLTPDFLAEVPLDPYDGEPLRYRRLADGVVVYSVGRDEVDNGGTIDRVNTIRLGTDVGYRLWDVKHRRQPHRQGPPPGGPG
jgi:hypothetical protein